MKKVMGWPDEKPKVTRRSETYGDFMQLDFEKLTADDVADACFKTINRAIKVMNRAGHDVGVQQIRIIIDMTDHKLIDDPEKIPALSVGWKCEVNA